MNLITIEVVCPAISSSFDFRFPVKMKFADVKSRIINDIRDHENQEDLFGDAAIFTEKYCVTDEMTLADANIGNGDRIMII